MNIIHKVLLFLIISLFNNNINFSQTVKGIYFPKTNNERATKCHYFNQVFQQKPKEIRFSIINIEHQLYLQFNDKAWFDRLFSASGDGVALDLVSKSRYACDKNVDKLQIRGELINAVYAQKLRRDLKKIGVNSYRVRVGEVPFDMRGQELEYNILFLSEKILCQYYTTFNLESYPWELLDMGMYLDSLSYKEKKIKSEEGYTTKYKTLKFTIPFEKNKSEYSPENIKPMYDSLSLTDFNIRKINIKAYASVEGSLERNLKLQKQRASSIARSLQSFQKPTIAIEVSSSENWVEFLNDIDGTDFEYLKTLSKKEIKNKLHGEAVQELEIYLKNHRKAIVTLELEKIDKYEDKNFNELIELFNQSIEEDEIEKAKIIQNSILNKAIKKSSPDMLSSLKIPKQKKYIDLLTQNSVTKYLINVGYMMIVKNELLEWVKLDPDNKKVRYNLAVIELELWNNNLSNKDEKSIQSQLLNLKKYSIRQDLIDRTLVNFHIIRAQNKMRDQEYDAKDESVEFILETYENFSLSNYDYLSLAQFLTYYSELYDAIDLLEINR